MNQDRMKNPKIHDLASALAEDVFELDIGAVDAELLAAGYRPEDATSKVGAVIARAIFSKARGQLAKAPAHVSETGTLLRFGPGEARAKLDAIVNRDPGAFPELTMAARKGQSISDADAVSQLEDFLELGIIDPDDLK
ncbi:hypothetical protein [Phyllobacterium sp. P30BS-XVII]|uniref:hypothetical protein n=1 Tax=Phyllobacterium sp. P30BS-XVII TaxID=2587046 RepID=UPI0018575007|nr:hypothetical protein [Phyllobacterium sp. P30BS-XVII]MBA8903092.1 hypothetical protein [Phyllobacterium sp. P30BS-XVII]